MRKIILMLSILCCAASASAATYYVSNIGSDSNNGTTKTTSWAHAPMQHGFTGSYSHSAGDQFIFRGGDTWGPTNYFSITSGGASGNPDYYGVDKTWFAGASWNRPIFAIAGSLPNQDSFGESRIFSFNAAWVTIDNWEITGGSCSISGPVSQNYFMNEQFYDGIVVTNGYFHAFQPPSGGCGNAKLGDGQNAAVWIYNQIQTNTSNCHGSFDHNVIDGTDGSGAKGYLTIVADGPGECATVSFNVMHDICSGITGQLVHDNVVGNFGGLVGAFECSSSGGIHNHAMRSNIDADMYNNVIFKTEGEVISMNPQSGGPGSHVFNNVLYANNASAIDIGDNGPNTTGHVYIFNNTIEQQTGGSFVFGNCINLENNVGLMLVANEYHIAASGSGTGCIEAANSPFNSSGKGTAATLTYNAANVLTPTLAQANSAGYTNAQTFVYSPTSSGSPTEGIGANETSLGVSTADATYACLEQTVSGVVQVVCPARTPIALPGSGAWQVGYIKFGSSAAPAVSFNPSSLTFAGTQIGTNNSLPIVLSNSGTANLTISSVSITGSGTFTETNNCVSSSPIAPSGSCTITVKFSPVAAGNVAGAVSVATNASGSPQTAGLSGTGTNVSPTQPVLVGSLPTGIVGMFYSGGLSASGGSPPYTWTVNPILPAGLSINTASGLITGTPTQPASLTETFSVTDAKAVASPPYPTSLTIGTGNPTITMSANPTSLSFTGTAGGSNPACKSWVGDDNGVGPLPVSLTVPSWIQAIAPGKTKFSVSICPVIAGLPAGNTSGVLSFVNTAPNPTGNTAKNTPLNVPVSITLTAAPTMSINCTTASAGVTNLPTGPFTMSVTSGGKTASCSGTH